MARPRNVILTDIVKKVGGIVTDPNNRNSLLQDWLIAIGGGPAAQRYFAQLNGTDAYFEYANTLVFAAGDTFEFEFLAPTSKLATSYALTSGDGVGATGDLFLLSDGTYNINAGATVTVDGVAVSGASNYPVDGSLHKVIMSFTGARVIKHLGVSQTGNANFYKGILANTVATINGVTTSNPIGLGTGDGDIEASTGDGPANAITYVNIPDADRELYTFTDDSFWLGQEVVVNGGFDTDSDWTKEEGWTISGGQAHAAVPVANGFMFQSGILTIGNTYATHYEMIDYTGADTAGISASSFAGMAVIQSGAFDFEGVALNTALRLLGRATNEFSFDNVSVKRKISIAP